MSFGLSQDQQDLIAAVRRLAKERLAPRAAVYDRDASHPRENWRDLWEHGLLATGVPKSHGGMELDPLSYALVLEEVAKACANTAMTVHMHSMVTRMIAAIGSAEQKERYFHAVVERGEMFGSWGSEPGVSITSGGFKTALERSGEGYVLNGGKYFCTMAGSAAYAMVWCSWKGDEDSAPGMTWAVVPTGHAGVEIHGDWDPLGLRGTVSPAATFDDCRVEADWVLGEPGDASVFGMGVLELFTLGWAAIYLGIGAGAFEFVRELVKREGPDGQPARALDTGVQRAVAEMALALDGPRLMVQRAASLWGGAGPDLRRRWTSEAKLACGDASLRVASRCLELVGGRAALKSMPLERAYRDIRTASIMPPLPDALLVSVGKAHLGLPPR